MRGGRVGEADGRDMATIPSSFTRHKVERGDAYDPPAELVARAAACVASADELDGIACAVLDRVMELGALSALLFLSSEPGGDLELLSHRRVPADVRERVARVALDAPLCVARAARSRRIEVIEDVRSLEAGSALTGELCAHASAESMVALPLCAHGRLLGVVSWSLPAPHPLTAAAHESLYALGAVFAMGLANVLEREAPITDEHGRVVMLIPEGRDITKRKQAAAALRESEERFRLTFANAPIGMAIVGLDGRFVRVNHAYCESLGYSAEELKKLRFQDITHVEDLDIDVGLAEQLQRGEIPRYKLAKRYIRKDGSVIPVILHASIVRDESGEPLYYIAEIEDITERKRAEEERERLLAELEAERRTLQTIFDNAPIPLLLIERNDEERVLANPHALDLTGGAQARSQYIGRMRRPDGAILTLDELPSSRAMRGETIPGEEFVVTGNDGRPRCFLIAAAPLRDMEGKVVGAVIAGEDISLLKEIERMREEWTSIIAHDLRQPINSIVFKASLLTKVQACRDKAEHILASALQLNRMITDLLDVSRLESHRMTLAPVPVELPALVGAVVERTVDATKGHAVEVDMRGEIPKIEADPGRIEQVLTNLLSNAAKYGAPDTPIRVVVERRSDSVQVAVENQGKGIPPDELPNLFTRHYRTREAKTGKVSGLGLGLYITKGLIEAHGGRIWAESTPGETTTFAFTLPLPR